MKSDIIQAGLSTPGNHRNTTKPNYFYCTTTFINLLMSILHIMSQTIFCLDIYELALLLYVNFEIKL